MEEKLKFKKTEYIPLFANTFPFITPKPVGKYLFPKHWEKSLKNPEDDTYIKHGRRYCEVGVKKGILIRLDNDFVIYKRKGADKRYTDYQRHDQALVGVGMSAILDGYDVHWGGRKRPDLIITYWEGDKKHEFPLELERGTNEKKAKGVVG